MNRFASSSLLLRCCGLGLVAFFVVPIGAYAQVSDPSSPSALSKPGEIRPLPDSREGSVKGSRGFNTEDAPGRGGRQGVIRPTDVSRPQREGGPWSEAGYERARPFFGPGSPHLANNATSERTVTIEIGDRLRWTILQVVLASFLLAASGLYVRHKQREAWMQRRRKHGAAGDSNAIPTNKNSDASPEKSQTPPDSK